MTDAKIKFYCKKCGQKLGAEPEWAGQVTYCPNCNESVVVPFKTEEKEPQVMRIPTTEVKIEEKHEKQDRIDGKIRSFLRGALMLVASVHAIWILMAVIAMLNGNETGFVVLIRGLASLAVSATMYGFFDALFAVLKGIYENTKKTTDGLDK